MFNSYVSLSEGKRSHPMNGLKSALAPVESITAVPDPADMLWLNTLYTHRQHKTPIGSQKNSHHNHLGSI